MKNKIEAALAILKENGYRIRKVLDMSPKTLFLIQYKEKGVIKFSYRKCKENNRATSWPKGTMIAKVNLGKLIWKPI